MGYSTDFFGSLSLSRKLTDTERNYINTFSGTRRMRRDVNKLMELYGGKYGYPFPEDDKPESIYGKEGEYFAKDDGDSGQSDDGTIIDNNTPPNQIEYKSKSNFSEYYTELQKQIERGECVPGLWCQWVIEDDENGNDVLEWDCGEKFYDYIPWMKYLIKHFFSKWGVLLNGMIEWQGDDRDDVGRIVVVDNIIKTQRPVITYVDNEEDS